MIPGENKNKIISELKGHSGGLLFAILRLILAPTILLQDAIQIYI